MINLAVINLKDIINFIKKLIILFIILFIFFHIVGKLKSADYTSIDELKKNYFSKSSHTEIIGKTILVSNSFSDDKQFSKKISEVKKILMSELTILETEEKLMEKENQEENIELNIENIEQKPEENIPNTLQTKIIEENNKIDTFTNIYNNVKIKNESKYPLTEEMMTPNVDLDNKKDIIIYHTHTCESYTPTEANNYVASGNFRTIDLNYSVARVGTELSNELTNLGFNVNHNTTYHDYPAYTGSYTRGLSTIQSILSNSNNAQFIIDLHRDALGNNSGYAPAVQIGEDVVAQVMFVIGSDGGGLEHPNWINNFKLAIKIQEKANEMYPGLFKPIILRDSRYNQHVSKGACIIEVGATGNTLEQCNCSMKYLARVIKEVMS